MSGINEILDLINKEISKINLPDTPKYLYEPISYSLSSGGKRIRPLLTMAGCYLFSDRAEDAMNSALAIEIFHNFTLLHDDIMDKSPIRRNRPTVYKKWNENVAILSGDAMMIKAYEYIARTPEKYLQRVLDIFNKTSLEVCEGQQLDMDFEEKRDVSIEEYIEMIGLKTASLIASALKIGAVCGGATEKDAELVFCYGRNIGIAFQIQDDYLDVYGNPDLFGKSSGNDILSNKKTYLLITALENLKGSNKAELINWLEKKEFDNNEKISAVMGLYEKADVKIITENIIDKYFSEAENCLKRLNVDDNRKLLLSEISGMLIKREK